MSPRSLRVGDRTIEGLACGIVGGEGRIPHRDADPDLEVFRI